MQYTIISSFAEILDNCKIKYDILGDSNEVIRVQFPLSKNPSVIITILAIADIDQSKEFTMDVYGLGEVNEITYKLYETINQLNSFYRYFKITIDENNRILLSTNALLDGDIGAQFFVYFRKAILIADEIYPKLMKVIWS